MISWFFNYCILRAMFADNSSPTNGHLTKKAEPPPTRDVNRDSGTDSANGGWLRRLVRRQPSYIPQKPIGTDTHPRKSHQNQKALKKSNIPMGDKSPDSYQKQKG